MSEKFGTEVIFVSYENENKLKLGKTLNCDYLRRNIR